MKPYFSIAELAKLFSDDYARLADALVACGVPLIYEGKPADISRWERIQPERRNSDGAQEISVKIGGVGSSPNPEAVVVSADTLPESWICQITLLNGDGGMKEYRRIPRKNCEKLTNLVLAAQSSGITWNEPVSLAEATDALVSAYHGKEMLFDGTWTGLVEPFSEKYAHYDENSLALKMADCVTDLYNIRWWEPSKISENSDRLNFLENLMILQKDVPVLWGRMCDILFGGKYKDDYWEAVADAEVKLSGINKGVEISFSDSEKLIVQKKDGNHREKEVIDKPLGTIERNSLLTILAALCEYSAIKYKDRGAAAQIAKLTEEIGACVSADTVKRVLEKIPDALENRMK